MRVALVGAELEENLALRSIHAAVVAAGHEAGIFDFHAPEQAGALVAEVLAYRPDVVGLSMVFTARAREFIALGALLRERGYEGHVTAGGFFASLHATKLLTEAPQLDSVLHGEGEEGLVELLEHLGALGEVRGLTHRLDDGQLATTERRPLPEDLDERPWPTRPERFEAYQGLRIANLLSGRGCYAHCRFCSIDAWTRFTGGVRFRQRRIDKLAAEMAWLYHARGVRLFNFHDDNFFHPRKADNLARFSELRARLDQAGVGRIGVQVKARPDSIDEETVRALVALGVFRVFLGVESSSVNGLRALGRGITREQNARALELLRGAGLHVTFNLLMFEPDCTVADLRDNVAFMRAHAEAPFNFCRTEVYGGTPLERDLAAQGRLVGSWLGYEYRIADPAAQRAWEMTRAVFTPRNFTLEGANHRTMAVEYEWKILQHFRPRAASRALTDQVRRYVREVNLDSVGLLEQILDSAEDPARQAQVTAELAAELLREEARLRERAAGVLKLIHRAADQTPLARRIVRAAAGAATAALLLGATCDDDVGPTHFSEMAAAPPRAQRPCTDAEQKVVETEVNRQLAPKVTGIVAKAGPFGVERVQAKLSLNHAGVVSAIDIDLPKEKRAHGEELESALGSMMVTGARGVDCVVWLAVGPPAPRDAGAPPATHPTERTPAPPPRPDTTHYSEMSASPMDVDERPPPPPPKAPKSPKAPKPPKKRNANEK